MLKCENQCVDCVIPCSGYPCPYINVPVDYCDNCGDKVAKYRLDGEDLCKRCAEIYIGEEFTELSLIDRAKLLGLDIHNIESRGI